MCTHIVCGPEIEENEFGDDVNPEKYDEENKQYLKILTRLIETNIIQLECY
jgi:hypothetical protein